VRDSLSVLDQLIAGSGDEGLTYEGAASLLGFTDGELLDATIDALAAGDGAAVFTQIDKVIESGHDPRRFVEDLLERLRDLIIVAAVPEGAASVLRGVPEDQLERMRGQQSRFGPGALTRAADIVNAGLTEMTGATAPRMQLELICARILLPAASGPSGYAARLDRLERRLDLGGVPSSSRPADAAATEVRPERTPSARAPVSSPSRPPASAPTASTTSAPTPATAAPTSAAGPRETIASAPPEAEQGPSSASPAAGARTATPDSAGLDTAALRRVWPDVLARIFTMRRVTWTFLSQHAQIVDYDGTKLVLGIATVGLANTFRAGNHAELVRQALIDEIGVDVPVEGVPMPDAGAAAGARAPAPAAAPPPRPPDPDPWPEPDPSFEPEPAPELVSDPSPKPTVSAASPPRDPPKTSRNGAPRRNPSTEGTSTTRRRTDEVAGSPDDAVSADDEDIATATSDGRAVVERVLGGQFLGELED
jgi:DNA polymerase-3 subunit gamma/tau